MWSKSHSVVSDSLWPHTVHGILRARTLEWLTFPFSKGSSQPRDQTQVSRIAGGFFTIWATREAQEYWSGQPIPSPEDLPDPGIEPGSAALQVDSLPTELEAVSTYKQWLWSHFWSTVKVFYTPNIRSVLGRKSFFPAPLDSMPGTRQIELTNVILTGEQAHNIYQYVCAPEVTK